MVGFEQFFMNFELCNCKYKPTPKILQFDHNKIGFTIREETFCSLITTIDLLITKPSQRKAEYTLHNFKFINYQSNKLCFNFDSPWWWTYETRWISWILNIAADKRESFVSDSLFSMQWWHWVSKSFQEGLFFRLWEW